jgi:phospholipid/cholesterol/gamma-HCH transport system substrate-binding protein
MLKKIPREIQVGVLAAAAIVMFIVGLGYLQGRSALERSRVMYTSFKDIDGLLAGNRILYKGMQVGQVRSIAINNETGRIDVSFDVSRSLDVPKGTQAMLVSLDIFNEKGIRLILSKNKELHEDGDTLRDTVETGLVASVTNQLYPVKDNINSLVTRLNKTMLLLNGTMGDSLAYYRNTELGKIVANIEVVTQQLAVTSGELKSTIVSIRTTSDDVQKTLAIIKKNEQNIDGILKNANMFTDTLRQSLGPIRDNLNSTMSGIRLVLDRANRGEGTLGLLLKDEKLYRNLERSTEDLDKLLVDIRQHPSRYVHVSIFGKKEKKEKE